MVGSGCWMKRVHGMEYGFKILKAFMIFIRKNDDK